MSIFELPTSFESRLESHADDVTSDESPRRGFDPRSIQIAGAVTAALVALGLLVSNTAKSDAESKPVVSSRVAPGAAAVEQSEGTQGVAPVQPPPAPAPVEAEQPPPAPQPQEQSDAPAWPDVQKLDESTLSGDTKWERHKGKGHWR